MWKSDSFLTTFLVPCREVHVAQRAKRWRIKSSPKFNKQFKWSATVARQMSREQCSADGKRSPPQSPVLIVPPWLKPSASTGSVNMQRRGRQGGKEGGREGRADGRGGNLRRRQETGRKRTECMCVNVHPSMFVCMCVCVCVRVCVCVQRVRRARRAP